MAPEKRLWSSSGWYLLHLISCFYHPDLHYHYQRFYRKLGIVLPCEKCRKHYREYSRLHPFNLGDNLVLWTIDYHNEVNSFTQKPPLTEQDVYDFLHFKNELVINHRYIWIFLKVLQIYHSETEHLPLYREFLRVFREIIPCYHCHQKLAKLDMETTDIPKYLKIIKKHHEKRTDKIPFKVK